MCILRLIALSLVTICCYAQTVFSGNIQGVVTDSTDAAADGRRGPIERAGALKPRSSARCRELPTAFHTAVAGTCFVWSTMMPGIAALNPKRPRRYGNDISKRNRAHSRRQGIQSAA